MKPSVVALVLMLAGCATASATKRDYVTALREPVILKEYGVILDGGSGSLKLIDASGREVSLYQDCSGANHPGRKKSRYGREIGDVVVEDLRSGRVIDYAGPEGAKLLSILDALKPVDAEESRGVRLFADFIRRKRKKPNQPPEPTVMSVTPRACARVAPATTVAHL